jgi:outer membrane immunogenic protein
VLIFATGGIADAGLEVNNDACLVTANACRTPTKNTRSGWIVGGGIEYALGGGWSAKGELLYADFGTLYYSDSPTVNNCVQCYSMNVKLTEYIGRVGLNYQFNWGKAPVLAKY